MEELKKCKSCGSSLDYTKAVGGVVECIHCGCKYTVAKSDSVAKNYLDMGMHGLDTCDFDDAFTAYQKAAELDKKEPEAYFGMALANAKVQYLKDYVNNRLQPIVHEVTEKSFLQDKYFKKALEFATSEQKKVYSDNGKEIDEIRRQFYELKKSGLKYDCFICVKVTEDGGRHTEDSTIASKLYHNLQDAGYSPFYSEEEIKGRTGADYEALILYALHCSSSMLLVCTDECYLQTPWVKNEYTRYLNLLNQEEKHRDSLTIIFTDNVIERLPGISGKIQGVPFKSYDALQRIIQFVDRFIDKSAPEISRKEYKDTQYKKKSVIKQSVTKRQLTAVKQGEITVSDRAKLGIAADFLKRRDFDKTILFCKNLIAENPSNSEAYWMTFLAEYGCIDNRELEYLKQPIKDFTNFEKAIASTTDENIKYSRQRLLFTRVDKFNYLNEYQEFIELPDSNESEIANLTNTMFKIALNKKSENVFNTIIKTVSNADKYMDMNLQFAHVLDGEKAVKYYKNILAVDEGHHESMWQIFFAEHNLDREDVFKYCVNKQNHAQIEERLYSYGYNKYASDAMLDICFGFVETDAELSTDFFDFLLSMIPQDNQKLYLDNICAYVNLLFMAKKPSLVTRYNDLLISVDKLNDNAHFTRCLINHNLYNPIGLIRYLDILLNDSDYMNAINIYTDKHLQSQNMYLDLYYSLEEFSKDLSVNSTCLDYLENQCFFTINDIIEKEPIRKKLVNAVELLCQDVVNSYGCYRLDDLYELRKNVTKNKQINLAYDFAQASKNAYYIDSLSHLLSNQSTNSEINRKEKRKDDVYKAATAISIISSLALIITLIVGMAGVQPLNQFWIVVFKGSIGAFLGVGIPLIILLVIICISIVISIVKTDLEEINGLLHVAFFCLFGATPLSVVLAIIWGILKLISLNKKVVTKIFAIIIIITTILCFGAGIIGVNAAKLELSSMYICDDYTLKLVNNYNGYTVTKYVGKASDVVLPSKYGDRDITAIGYGAFRDNKELSSIKMPDGVTSIGNYAFYDCRNLKSVNIPNKVTEIGEHAFYGCRNLKSVNIPNKVTEIGEHAFDGCNSLTEIDLPYGLKSIGKYAFCDTKLTQIYIPNSVDFIGEYVFSGCNELKVIYCEAPSKPNNWKTGWNNNSINKKVEIIWEYKSIRYQADNGINYLIDGQSARVIKQTGEISSQIVIPSAINYSGKNYPVIKIDENAFLDYKGIEYIFIPDSITTVGEAAFRNCTDTKIYCQAQSAPDKWHGDWNYRGGEVTWGVSGVIAYNGINYLMYNDKTASVLGMAAGDYYPNRAVRRVTIPSTISNNGTVYNVKSIVDNAFKNNTYIQELTISDGIVNVGSYAFYSCKGLTRVYVPSSVTIVGSNAFSYCSSAKIYCGASSRPNGWSNYWKQYVDDNNVYWDASGIYDDGRLIYILHADKTASIGGFASGNTMSNLSIPKKIVLNDVGYVVTAIADRAFRYNKDIREVILPDNIASVGAYAFDSCTGLTKVVIPISVTTMGNNAFGSCPSGTKIYCVASSRPSGWSSYWNRSSSSTVTWNYKGV